jgi:GT2 family glycosyltransferase
MNSAANRVYVIIVTYNFLPWVERCLGSLRASNYPINTIIVDNASADGTVVFVRERFPEVTVIANDANRGFGAANNQGMALALDEGADFFFLLNQDTWIFPETVGRLVDAMGRAPEYGIVSPLHYTADEVTLDAAFCSYLVKDYAEQPDMLPDGIYAAGFINAAAWLIHRKCLEDVGGFGDLFYHYGEDRDYVQRIRYYGYLLGFVSSSRIVHDRPPRRFDIDTADKAIWYYTTGAKARLTDVNQPYAIAWIAVWFWFIKDMMALIFKGKMFAFPAGLKIFYTVFIRGSKSILQYREKIGKRVRYLFLQR